MSGDHEIPLPNADSADSQNFVFVPRIWRLLPLFVSLLLIFLGWHVRSLVDQAVKEEFAKKLVTILEADVTALELWIDQQMAAVRSIAATKEVADTARELWRIETSGPQALLGSTALHRLRASLVPHTGGPVFFGFVLVSKDGVHLASDRDGLVGRRGLGAHGRFLAQALEGTEVISVPFPSLVPLPDEQGNLQAHAPTMFVAAPVRTAGEEVIAALCLRVRPEKEFTRILTVARSGQTGETYAFDKTGLMISASRFDTHLRQIGLLPNRADAHSILNVEIRDPGANLLTGKRPERLQGDRPLTRMAASATQGHTDFNVEGYRDYRGVPVIGAWTWLDEHDFGVATEVDVEEAYRPLQILRSAFFLLFSLLVVAAAALVFFSRSILILRGRVRKALTQVQRLGHYTLEEKIGSGGLGEVFLARHVLLKRPTALKIFHLDRHDDEGIRRFEREVQLASRLNHPNTIRIYDYGFSSDGTFYYAMEYLAGGNLVRLVELAGPLPESRVIHILLQICGSLQEAHQLGMIHRDIKPENLILCEHGGFHDFVVVVDFGLAKEMFQEEQAGVTNPKFAVGTPRYLPPEAVRTGSRMDARSDLYSLGAVGYWLLTGCELFDTRDVLEIIRRHLSETPDRPSLRLGRPLAPDLEALIMKCLEKDPNDRPQSAREVARQLRECEGFGKWSEEDARDWWAEFGQAMLKSEQRAPVPAARARPFTIVQRPPYVHPSAGRSKRGK